MNKTYLFITALFVLIFMSCQSAKKNNTERQNEVELVAEKQLAFPLDEQTYYLSISIYQFEENGKEYLHFENTRKSLYDIVIFDIENKQIAKRIPLHKTGPNGLPAVYGSRPSPDSKYILIAQNDISRLSSINDKGEVIRNYDFQTPEGKFAPLHFGSYYNTPAFVKDSCLFMEMSAHKPNMKKKDWSETHMFASLDLRTGEKTRDPLYLGYTFKGAGALDPRGYPIMYVGAGYNSNEGTAKVFVVNLLDCSVMYTFGDNDEFSLRGSLSFFDGSALVDAETDTLIYPGENGILYLIRLNTKYDLNSGTLSIDPGRTVKWRYYGTRSSTESFWLGMEDSAAIYKGYIFMTDNGGNLMCLDLNTLQLVWVQDTLDDSNSTPVLEIEKGHLYLYVSTSFRLGWRSYDTATVPVWKIDAETGEIVWHTDYECTTDDGVSGGVQSTIACGKNSLADYIYVTVAKTSDNASGVLACLRKSDGSKAWEDSSSYAWSSPVCVYNKDGSGKVLYCNSTGDIRLLDGKTGKQEDVLSVSEGVIEASPAVYDNYAVVGTRDCKIWGIRLQ